VGSGIRTAGGGRLDVLTGLTTFDILSMYASSITTIQCGPDLIFDDPTHQERAHYAHSGLYWGNTFPIQIHLLHPQTYPG